MKRTEKLVCSWGPRIGAFAFAVAAAWPGVASADTFDLCLWVRYDVVDDHANDDFGNGVNGPNGNKYIQARNVDFELWNVQNPNSPFEEAYGWTDGSGCVEVSGMDPLTDYQIVFWTTGLTQGSNEVTAHNQNVDVPSYWTNAFTTPGGGGLTLDVYVTSFLNLPHMHAIINYIMEERFLGNMDHEAVHLYYHNVGPCAGTGPQMCPVGGEYHLEMDGADPSLFPRRKLVLGHEYGHANLWSTMTGGFVDDCSFGDGHNMTSHEFQSCAAMEGWAHFVAADAWNDHHDGANPNGFIVYPSFVDAGGTPVNVEQGNGAFVDDACSTLYNGGGACSTTRGVELDWLRMFWDYHTNDGTPGTRPDHIRMQQEIDAAPDWAAGGVNVADAIRDGVDAISGETGRWNTWLDWNGIEG